MQLHHQVRGLGTLCRLTAHSILGACSMAHAQMSIGVTRCRKGQDRCTNFPAAQLWGLTAAAPPRSLQGPAEMDNATLGALERHFGPLRGFDVQSAQHPVPGLHGELSLTSYSGKVASLLYSRFQHVGTEL